MRSYGSTLGKALILYVGYNEGAPGYAAGLDRVVRTALAQGVKGVVWVTLREAGKNAAIYRSTNAIIRNALARRKAACTSRTGRSTAAASRGSAGTPCT